MTSRVFFDTNVLVYALGDPRVGSADPRPDPADLLEPGGVVSLQVLAEYADVANRKLGFNWDKIPKSLAIVQMLRTRIVPLSAETQRAVHEEPTCLKIEKLLKSPNKKNEHISMRSSCSS